MHKSTHKKERDSFLKFKMPPFRGPIFALVALAMAVVGLQVATSFAPASADTSLTISTSAKAVGTPTVTFSNKTLATPGGKTQLLWWYPNHHIKVTKKQVRKAPHIKVNATGANASKVIAKKAHGASVVVLKVGSVVRNTGKLGHIVGGFKWHVTHQAVLKWNKKLKLYQHVYNVIGGKLHKTCGNHIGGPVSKMYTKVVQVRYASSLQYTESVSATATATGYAHVTGTCPDGTVIDTTLSASGSAKASSAVSFTSRTQTSVTNAKRKSYQNSTSLKASASANAEANARAEVDIKCGSTPPPPPATQAPTVNLSAGACVNEGEKTGVVTGNVGNPNDESGTGTLTLTPTAASKNITVAANGSGSFSFSGLAAGTYTVSLNMFGKTVSDTATLEQCSTPPPPAQSITITSLTQLNMIPAGKSSNEFSIGVNASAAGGSLTVDPGIGSVSACTDTTGANRQDSMVFSNLGSGNSSLCVLLWAPNDADQPASMTVTFTAILGTAKDVKTETVPITYPTRP